MNIMLLLVLISMNFLMAFIGRIVANPHKNIILETTLPKDKLNDSQVTQVRQSYKKTLLIVAVVFSLMDLLLLLIPYDSIAILFLLLSLFGMIGVNYYTQVLYIRKMTAVKMKNNWILPTKPLLVDTKLILNKNRKMLKAYWFLPSILISLSGIIYTIFSVKPIGGMLLFGSISLLTAGLFIFSYYLVSRLPVKALTSDEQTNQQVNDAMRYYWSLLLVSSTFVFSPLSFLPTLSLTMAYGKMMYLVIGYFTLLFIYIGFIFFLMFRLRKTQDQLILQASDYRYGDDDQYWRYGLYINPEDPRIMVPDRLGMNMSVNLGRPAGKISMVVLSIVVIATTFIASVPLLINDFSSDPFRMELTANEVSLSAPFSKTREIPIQSIESVVLVDTLPENSLRVYGAATEHYLTGEFRVDDEPAYLLVYQKETPIMKITTKEYTYYYTNKDPEKTQKEYELLLKKLA
ncbi:hypothetical protein I6N96_09275 [Enterococcus sp. BWM-S5]|uniref:Bacterial Pleckstrin homology domain-containing protein n=1 Tax=Enterococcus larvae TaxID=2794352 RepID=A0ABS4CJ43_9ENTE|nr:DUF5808 domain-containing protein [Enterococcus larvae]MBP1046475.1 hypothetical protein [Enterococcus larvae]